MKITAYRFGKMKINHQEYTKDLIILQDRIIENWRRKKGHLLQPDDLGLIIKAKPEILVIGNGFYGFMKISPEAEKMLENNNIQIKKARSKKAVKLFNAIENRNKAAAFHITC